MVNKHAPNEGTRNGFNLILIIYFLKQVSNNDKAVQRVVIAPSLIQEKEMG